MSKVKNILFAYPGSTIAKKYGMSTTGCHYVFVGDEDSADMFNHPWGNYSLNNGEFK